MEQEVTYIRLDPEAKRMLQRIATLEARSLSSLLRKVIIDWLKQQQKKRL